MVPETSNYCFMARPVSRIYPFPVRSGTPFLPSPFTRVGLVFPSRPLPPLSLVPAETLLVLDPTPQLSLGRPLPRGPWSRIPSLGSESTCLGFI